MLDKIQTAQQEQVERDSLGGGFVVDSDLYEYTVDKAYMTQSASGAYAVNLALVTDDKKTLEATIYITTAEGKTFYVKDGKENNLPGFTTINNLCLLAAKKDFLQLPQENKIVPVYDKDAKAKVNKSVPVIVDLIGTRIIAGVIKQVVDKTEDTGALDPKGKKIYAPTGETREVNEIDKFFRAKDGLTVAEILAGSSEAAFKQLWADKHKGVTQMRAKGVKGGKTGVPGAPAAAGGTAAKSLFED
jgi:hypothetical protein